MRIVLFDYETGGHHYSYIQLFAKAFFELGYEVIAMFPHDENTNSPNDITSDSLHIIKLEMTPKKPTKKGFFATRNYVISLWKHTAIELNRHGIDSSSDLIFFPSLDEYLTAYIAVAEIDRLFKYKWTGLYLKPPFLRVEQKFSFLRKGILNIHHLLNSKNCSAICVLDAGIIDSLEKITKPDFAVCIPDIVDDAKPDTNFEEITTLKSKIADRKVILLIGSIDRRKGLINFLEASEKAEAGKYFFIVAGKIALHTFSRDEVSFINECKQTSNTNLFFYDKRIPTENEFNGLISVSDVLFAAYINFPYSSNMIGKAVGLYKPIIVSKGYLMEELVTKYEIGVSVAQNSVTDILTAIAELTKQNALNSSGIKNYLSANSWNNFCQGLGSLMKKIEA